MIMQMTGICGQFPGFTDSLVFVRRHGSHQLDPSRQSIVGLVAASLGDDWSSLIGLTVWGDVSVDGSGSAHFFLVKLISACEVFPVRSIALLITEVTFAFKLGPQRVSLVLFEHIVQRSTHLENKANEWLSLFIELYGLVNSHAVALAGFSFLHSSYSSPFGVFAFVVHLSHSLLCVKVTGKNCG
jgi:hypothetical protein